MSIYSTKSVTRKEAIEMIEDYHEKSIYEMENEELADKLFELYGDTTLNNYIVEGEKNE